MTEHFNLLKAGSIETGLGDVIKLAVLAVGGQGGGVLTNWIADLATRGGYAVQMTSIAGVAQRTGATIYYVEMAPKTDRNPVFAQSPAAGDLDILIAAELMEAGRAVIRGFVTPDRTTLIASTHRILAISEKQVPGDGRSDEFLVEDEIVKAALRAICFDMEIIASDAGSMISASLFGGLAKSGSLPFKTELFEEVIKSSGRGVEQSLAAFRGALEYVPEVIPAAEVKSEVLVSGPTRLLKRWNELQKRLNNFDLGCRDMIAAGLRKVVDYQDIEYGIEYLNHLESWHINDSAKQDFALTNTAAKYIANAMCYDDILRVADLKIRASRNLRLRNEQEAGAETIVHVTEYFHPRAEEICATLPVRIGRSIQQNPRAFKILDQIVNKGRRIRTDRLIGFGFLRAISMLKPYRRALLRHQQETIHLNKLLDAAHLVTDTNYELAIEILSCQRLVKGYSDTYVRGYSKFSKVMSALDMLQDRDDAAQWMRRLREVALQDENGEKLDGALATVASFAKA